MTRLGAVNFARMPRTRLTAAAGVALTALSIGLFAGVQPAFAATFAGISGAGSTWSYNAINQWTGDVNAYGMPVFYTADGSTVGRQLFAQGTVDFGASDIPYGVQDGSNSDPPPERGYTYMPDTAGGVAFMYNLEIGGQRVTNLRLSGATIAGIFTNKITMWNDPAIAADNPGLTLPAETIVPVVRSDGSGATWEFTQWMMATQGSSWTAYCQVVGLSPCTAATAYPVQPGTDMVGQAGDLGVSGYVSQQQADGAIGYVEYSHALETGFPVAKVLNAAGYYTAPTAGNVGVSLLKAQINTDSSSVLYGTADLSQVYADTDPRTYELSYYSYLILPTDSSNAFSANKGYTLGFFGQYALCQGQQQVDELGYAALPINLVEDGYAQLQKVPGASLPSSTSAFIASCNNPTFAVDGTNTLANTFPMPPACDQQGPTQCTTTTTIGGVPNTETGLTASPSDAVAGQSVVLTATVSTPGSTFPAGSVQFLAGLTAIGSPVTVVGSPATGNLSGVATTTTTFASPGFQTLSAVFTPTSTSYASSTGTYSEFVQPAPVGGSEPLAMTVPATGSFTLTVGTGTVPLTVSVSTATGALNLITVTDTRNSYPGWSVSGQASDFTGGGSAAGGTISGNQLGWVPSTSSLATGAALGGVVAPTAPGLGSTAAVLASAAPGGGFGTSSLGANLTLDIPVSTEAGPYTSTLTITAVTTGP
jgi:phosphate ABC transporter phosphate-binding protein